MSITTLSSRELNQDTSGAKKAALVDPAIITDRGLTVVTRNLTDFEACGVRLLNPWKN